VAQGAAPPGRREWDPSSRPQREALRSGEWVTEPARRGRALRYPPASSARTANLPISRVPGPGA